MTHSAPNEVLSSKSVAELMLQRRRENRQRFDSADYAMARQQRQHIPVDETPSPGPLDEAMSSGLCRASSGEFSDWVQCEREPEPEVSEHTPTSLPQPVSSEDAMSACTQRHQVRRIRLQRFDSADWAMQCHKMRIPSSSSSLPTVPAGDDNSMTPSTEPGAVAKLMLDRHAYKTCHFVSTPIGLSQRYLENA